MLQPARRALLPCASRPAALRVAPCCSQLVMPCCSQLVAPYCSQRVAPCCSQRIAPYCSQRVALYCSQRVALCCPARRALLQPARRALLQPARRALLPHTSHPATLHSARHAALSTARPALQPAAHPTRRIAATTASAAARAAAARATAAAAGGASGSAGSAAGAEGAGGVTGSAGGAAGAGAATGGQRLSLPLPDDPTPQQLREWVLQRARPRGGGFGFLRTAERQQQSQLETFSPQVLSELFPQRCVTDSVEVVALRARESTAALGASESAATLGARASPTTGPSSAEALHTFTLDSDSPLAPLPRSPLPTASPWYALPSPCLWPSQIPALPPVLACSAVPSLRRGAAVRRSSLLRVSSDHCSFADSPHRRAVSSLLTSLRSSVESRVSSSQTSPTLRWTGKVGDASVFWVWGALSLVRDAKASKLSSRTLRCAFLGFPTDAPPWQFYHPRSRSCSLRGDPAADDTAATRRSPRLETPPGFPPRPSSPPPQPAAVDFRAETAGAEPGGAETEGEGSGGAATGGAGSGGAATGGAGSWGAATGGADSEGPASPSGGGAVGDPAGGPGAGQPPPGGGGYGPAGARAASPGGTAGARGTGGTVGGAGGAAGAGGTRGAAGAEGAGATSPRGASGAGGAGPTSPRGTAGAVGAGGAAGVGGTGARGTGGAGGASPRGARTTGAGAAGAGGGVRAGGATGAAGSGGTGGTAGTGGAGAAGAGGTAGTGGAGGAGGTAGARGAGAVGTGGTGGAGAAGPGAAGPGGARTRGAGAAGIGGSASAGGAGSATGAAGTGGAGGTTGARGPGAAGARGAAGAGGAGGATGGAGAGGAGAASAGGAGAAGTALRQRFFYRQPQSSLPPPDSVLRQVLSLPSSTGLTPPLLCSQIDQSPPQLLLGSSLPAPAPHTEVTESLTEHREPETRASTPVRARRIARPCPPAIPGTHGMALRPSSIPQHVVLPEPPASSLPHVPDPESDLARAASPTVTRLLATDVTDPNLESTAVFALVTELVDFAVMSPLDYVASLVIESEFVCPPSVWGELALSSDVLEDRQFELECLVAALPRFASMLLCPKGDPDALNIPTPRSYAEAITGEEYSSRWHTAMDASFIPAQLF
ncbi:unnamed protein product [Closterium sp. NIES-54]